ncbi:hypothetical protein M902_1941 [Bacteriovorax sp. BAL6_X]|uniref:hypothetical protein n=1 Tax=Bacteriovorax sp. BAL6_X TaxID=1201290 RepID=UPI0003854C28|nr:hypothetical protein [Bacteriovorax sp. BAL6_X]EPZ51700.1 hypothetical protein M902_1941 [Bacteriovorax sp. BAL6_X]
MLRSVFTLFTFILSLTTFALSQEPKTVRFKNDTSWSEVAKKYEEYKDGHISDFAAQLKDWNQHIDSIEGPRAGQSIYLTSPYSPALSWKYAEPLNAQYIEESKDRSTQLVLKAGFSNRIYNQTYLSNIEAKYQVNFSPSLEIEYLAYLSDNNRLEFTASYTKLSEITLEGSNQEIDENLSDYELTILDRIFSSTNQTISFSIGLNSENFQTIKTSTLSSNKLSFNQNNLYQGMLGLGLHFRALDMNLIYANTIFAKNENEEEYSGSKVTLSVDYFFKNTFGLNGKMKFFNYSNDTSNFEGTIISLAISYKI